MAPSASHTRSWPMSMNGVRELILPLGIIGCVLVILIPLPAGLIDIFLVGSITLSVIILLTTISIRTPLEFSIFPSLLLAATLVRLVLNVATTRLILTRAHLDGVDAAGGVIQTFGDFVSRGNVVVGMILFAIIVLIQFLVITKGATRIGEVAARFALDGLPGRQMAIDTDVSAGVIDEATAHARRQELHQHADFLGAMDGASKFVRGDAVAGLVITGVNIVGGLVIGIGQAGMGPLEAAEVFTKLTIGDGLVSQVPALLVSLAAGLLMTRSSHATNLSSEFLGQLFSRPQSLAIAGAFLGLLVFTGLPRLPLMLVAGSCIGTALLLIRAKPTSPKTAIKKNTEENSPATKTPTDLVEDLLLVDPLELEIGLGLIKLADRARGGDLLDRIQAVRQQVATQIGIVMPKVRVRDNLNLASHQYRIRIAETVVAEGTARSSVVLAKQLTDTVLRHADEILSRDATRYLIDQLKRSHPVVVDELIPNKLSLGEVQQVLLRLLREGVSIRPLAAILEALGDHAEQTKDVSCLTEQVRRRLARAICEKYRAPDGRLHVVTLDPAIEESFQSVVRESAEEIEPPISPSSIEVFCQQIDRAIEEGTGDQGMPLLLVSPQIRVAVKHWIASRRPDVVVLSYQEITQETELQSTAVVQTPQLVAA